MNQDQSNIERRYIYDLVKKIDLVAFIEREAQASFVRRGARWTCRCPMPHHRDKSPSFGVMRLPDGTFVFNCFGCGSKGTIIDFCMDFWALDNASQALELITSKMDLGSNEDIIRNAINNLRVTVDEEKQVETQHIRSASCCNNLLRRYPEREDVRLWVANKYRLMNEMLEKSDMYGLHKVASEASQILLTGVIENGRKAH